VGYKAVLAKWAEGDYSERRSTIGWPPEFDKYVRESYAHLKSEQMRLIHGSSMQAWHRMHDRSAGRSKSPKPAPSATDSPRAEASGRPD